MPVLIFGMLKKEILLSLFEHQNYSLLFVYICWVIITVNVHTTTSDNVLLNLGLGRIGIYIYNNQIVF